MPLASTQAFILGATPFNDQDKLVVLLTKNKGILKAVAPGALKYRNRFGSLLELFTQGDFQYYWKENKELITLSKGDIVKSNFNTISDIRNVFYFYLISEILSLFIPYNHKDPRIFRLVEAVIDSLANQEIKINHMLLYFLIWILRIEGMMFDSHNCSNCQGKSSAMAWLRTDFRGILCQSCKSDEKLVLLNKDLKFIRWTKKYSPRELHTWQDKIDPAKMIRIFIKKIEFHGEFSLKSSLYLTEFK